MPCNSQHDDDTVFQSWEGLSGGRGAQVIRSGTSRSIRAMVPFRGQVRFRRRHRRREVGHRPAGALVQSCLDLVDQDVAGPAVVDGAGSVPEAGFRVAELLKHGKLVVLGQLCKRRLQQWDFRPVS